MKRTQLPRKPYPPSHTYLPHDNLDPSSTFSTLSTTNLSDLVLSHPQSYSFDLPTTNYNNYSLVNLSSEQAKLWMQLSNNDKSEQQNQQFLTQSLSNLDAIKQPLSHINTLSSINPLSASFYQPYTYLNQATTQPSNERYEMNVSYQPVQSIPLENKDWNEEDI